MSWLGVVIGVGIAVVFISLVFLILWLFPDESKKITVPGMEPSSNLNGNMDDIIKAGSIQDFLVGLHKVHGPIASFWFGTVHTVSVASVEYFKQQLQLFDRPVDLFNMYEPMVIQNSVQFANGMEGKARRMAYDKLFEFDCLDIHSDRLRQAAEELTSRWAKADIDDHFPLGQHMALYCTRAAFVSLMGDSSANEKDIFSFHRNYSVVWEEVENRLTDPLGSSDDSDRAMSYLKGLVSMRDFVERSIKGREAKKGEKGEYLLIDAILKYDTDEEKRVADAVTFIGWSFNTTANLLTWCIYYLCMHEEVQENLYSEISTVLEPKEQVNMHNMGKLKYLRQVMDESLRCAQVVSFTARCSDEDTELGGHRIPSGTPVIHALGVSLMDKNVWPAPAVFDPDRFSENRSRGRPSLAFSPFGFAGRRQCPAYRLFYLQASVFLVNALQSFKFLLVPGQDIKPYFSLITRPKDEIWFKVAKRS